MQPEVLEQSADGRLECAACEGERTGREHLRPARSQLRDVLIVQAEIELVPWGSLQRSEYKSRLIDR